LSKNEKKQKIEELARKLSALREQKDTLKAEAEKLAEKRDMLHQKLKDLRSEILKLKNARNEVNARVKELKQQRSQIKNEIAQKIEELKGLRNELELLMKKKPTRSSKTLEKEIDSLEWKIQTTPLSLQEEKKLVERIMQLQGQINIHKKFEQFKQKRIELKAEVKALQARVELCHKNILEHAKKSQEIHQELLKKVEEARKIKNDADNVHELYLKTRDNVKSLKVEMAKISDEMKRFREEISTEEEKERKEVEEKLLENIEKQAREKLKRGEKLTWEEFKVLAEKGLA
jgi:uncharacterized coiled-coil DUF342 family protein